MIKLYRWLEKIWFQKIPQKLRFLLVGGFNTVASYLLFTGLYFLLNRQYILSVVLQYILSINISIVTMRYYVFQSHGSFIKEYLKAASVYAYLLVFNTAWLFVFIDAWHVNALVSQAGYLLVSTILTYLCHKHFSFKEKKLRNAV